MFTIKLFSLVFVVLALLIGALLWERRKNKKQGNLTFSDLPFLFKCIGQGVKQEYQEARLTKYNETLKKFKKL